LANEAIEHAIRATARKRPLGRWLGHIPSVAHSGPRGQASRSLTGLSLRNCMPQRVIASAAPAEPASQTAGLKLSRGPCKKQLAGPSASAL
jgi:hypothetical protein